MLSTMGTWGVRTHLSCCTKTLYGFGPLSVHLSQEGGLQLRIVGHRLARGSSLYSDGKQLCVMYSRELTDFAIIYAHYSTASSLLM